MGHRGSHQQPGADGFAVEPPRVVRRGLDGVPEGVAEVQKRPVALLPLIAAYDLRLDLARALDDVRERLGIRRKKLLHMLFEPIKEGGITNEPIFDDLGDTRPQLARRQGRQEWRCRRSPRWAGETRR